MVVNYMLSYLKNLVFKKAEDANLVLIIIFALGIISAAISECFLAYFAFLVFKDFYEYSSELAIIFTAGGFCLQAMLLFCYSYYSLKRAAKDSFFSKGQDDFQKAANAFWKGFQKKP